MRTHLRYEDFLVLQERMSQVVEHQNSIMSQIKENLLISMGCHPSKAKEMSEAGKTLVFLIPEDKYNRFDTLVKEEKIVLPPDIKYQPYPFGELVIQSIKTDGIRVETDSLHIDLNEVKQRTYSPSRNLPEWF